MLKLSSFFSIILASISISQLAQAQTTEDGQFAAAPSLGAAIGFKQTSVETEAPVTSDSNMGVQAGVLFYSPMANNMEGRVGALYGQRNFTLTQSSVDTAVKLSYLDVPLTVGFAPSQSLSIFGGFLFSLNIDKSCTSSSGATCKVTGTKGFDTALTFGGSIKIAETFGIEVFYEKNSGRLADGADSPSSAGINLLYLTQ